MNSLHFTHCCAQELIFLTNESRLKATNIVQWCYVCIKCNVFPYYFLCLDSVKLPTGKCEWWRTQKRLQTAWKTTIRRSRERLIAQTNKAKAGTKRNCDVLGCQTICSADTKLNACPLTAGSVVAFVVPKSEIVHNHVIILFVSKYVTCFALLQTLLLLRSKHYLH
jgi:hypothetical protein